MTEAFDDSVADFSGIVDPLVTGIGLYISRVLHKTYIEVGEAGTRAAAVTGVLLDSGGVMYLEPPKEISLDRPFVYLIYDVENNLPLFIGTLNDPNG